MRRRASEDGAALLTVLLLVSVMAVLSAVALEKLKIATHLASNGAAIEQARSYAMAAESVASSNDSGQMHIADAIGTPTIGIICPTSH